MKEETQEKSFVELQTLGHEETLEAKRANPDAPSWTVRGLSQAETLKPAGGGIVDDGRTDAVLTAGQEETSSVLFGQVQGLWPA